MKKFWAALIVLLICFCTAAGFIACGGNDPDGGGNNGNGGNVNNGGGDPGSNGNPPEETYLPTAEEIVAARKSANAETVQGYDFTLTITGNFGALGLGAAVSGNYDGSYRYDGGSDELTFKRTTSGALLGNSTCYVFTSGDSRMKATMDGNAVKKVSVELPEDQNITMVNLPVVAIVDAIDKNNISDVKAVKNSSYDYSCQLSAGNSNPVYSALDKVFEKLGTGVSFQGIELAETASTLDFSLKDDKLNDFHLGFKLQIAVHTVTTVINVDYSQKGALTEIALPNMADSGILYNAADVRAETDAINAAIDDLKDDDVYSLDLTAENDFDPGWNRTAVVDSYTARMYKRTIDGDDWFNHSYYYKAHSETSGKETYKYTIGNVNGEDADNQGTWLISRKSTNTQTKLENITADTQFDFLTSVVKQRADGIDCIKKQTSGTATTYTVHLGKSAAESVQKSIIDMINTNAYGDVIAVDNYFNSENIVKEAEIEIVLTNGKISSVICDTELCYTPTGGDYTEYNITLTNRIEMQVNENLTKAQSYEAPDKVKGNIIGWGKNLNDSEYYIL